MNEEMNDRRAWQIQRLPTEPEYCGVYWIITTCLTGIALGVGSGGLLWLVLA